MLIRFIISNYNPYTRVQENHVECVGEFVSLRHFDISATVDSTYNRKWEFLEVIHNA